MVLPKIIITKKAVVTNSVINTDVIEYPPGESSAYPFAAKLPTETKSDFPETIKNKVAAATIAPRNS